ncbi:hypothetical protein NSTC731_05875 [Nostoc sp. DSM 114167]|jgi:hypothetical protein
MDVELQIIKHLARYTHPIVAIINEYCTEYKDLFKFTLIVKLIQDTIITKETRSFPNKPVCKTKFCICL